MAPITYCSSPPQFHESKTPDFSRSINSATNLANPQDFRVYTSLKNLSGSSVDQLQGHDFTVFGQKKLKRVEVDDEPLNGGFIAWSQVFVSFLLVFNGFGYFSSFGLFQSHWTETLQSTQSDIAWVGSISLFLLFFLGTISGPLMDRGHFRSIIALGCAFQILGVFSTSVVYQYWQLILAQGIVQGIGNGMLFTPCVALVSVYFNKNRAFALSLAACGAPIGGIVFPLVFFSHLGSVCTQS